MNYCNIEPSNEKSLFCNKFLQKLINEISFSHDKKILSKTNRALQVKTLLSRVSITKCSTSSSRDPFEAHSDWLPTATNWGAPCLVLASPTHKNSAGAASHSQRAQPFILKSKPPLIASWKSLLEWRPDGLQWLNTDPNLKSAAWQASCKGLFPLESQNNQFGVWIHSTSIEDVKLRQVSSFTFP